VAINCAAIPPELMESELFGHEKGAFTGAYNRSIGKLEFAHDGTVFLDEVGDLRLEFQAKLLRFLQEREFTRVGGNRAIRVNVRMIAASNISLKDGVQKKLFREDLYFRLNVIPVELPPLHRRKGDVPLLTNFFLDKFNRQLKQNIEGITSDAMAVLEGYDWPGNIRELENLIERLVVLRSNERWIDVKDLPFDLFFKDESANKRKHVDKGLLQARQIFEHRYILRALRTCKWNQTKTARMLKIHRNTLIQKIKALDIKIEAKE
jgi:transcriptional regulator with PAS, ATPase and Fis domain